MTDHMEITAYRFRTAVGGFHKGDVAAYITKSAQAHKAELELKDKLIQQQHQEIEALQQQVAALTLAAEAPETAPETAAEITESLDQTPALTELELAAYRRAEAAERLANTRARKLYQQMEALCCDTVSEFEEAKLAAEQTAQAVLDQANVLNEACKKLSQALSDSRDQLSAMDAMIPDPAETLEETL